MPVSSVIDRVVERFAHGRRTGVRYRGTLTIGPLMQLAQGNLTVISLKRLLYSRYCPELHLSQIRLVP